MKISFRIIGLVAAATIGSGVFALPYVIQRSGWLVSLGYFVALIAAVSLAHILYLRTLTAVKGKERLLGLAKHYFGGAGFWAGFLAIVVGLLLSFVAYLVLGAQFIRIIVPGISPPLVLAFFWLMIAMLVFKSEGSVAGLELAGISLIFCAIFFVFISGNPIRAFSTVIPVDPRNIFLPFGAVLFSLAGWTSVEQVYEIKKGSGVSGKTFLLFVLGAAIAGLLYWLFALGILGSSPYVTTDTISGTLTWPFWKRDILAAIGLLAMGIVSLPLAREIRGALEKDLGWNSILSRCLIVALPLALVLSGFNNFLLIVSVAGGIFLSAQYILIISIGRKTLSLSRREKILLDALTVIFVCAAIYEIIMFIVH